jgi:hypothetical protein
VTFIKALTNVPHSSLMNSIGEVVIGPLKECCQVNYENRIACSDFRTLCEQTFKSQEKWKKERQFRITGSRCYEIYTYNKDEWDIKCGKYFWPTPFNNKFAEHGIKCEQVARAKYSRILSVEVIECGLVVSPKIQKIGYSPDGVILKNGEPWKLLKIKCPFKGKRQN